MDRDMGALVRAVVKDMQWNRPVEKIAKRQDVMESGFAAHTSVCGLACSPDSLTTSCLRSRLWSRFSRSTRRIRESRRMGY